MDGACTTFRRHRCSPGARFPAPIVRAEQPRDCDTFLELFGGETEKPSLLNSLRRMKSIPIPRPQGFCSSPTSPVTMSSYAALYMADASPQNMYVSESLSPTIASSLTLTFTPDCLTSIVGWLHWVKSLNATFVAALTSPPVLLGYEHIITFDKEVDLFWHGKMSRADALFLFNRYLALVAITLPRLTMQRMHSEVGSLPIFRSTRLTSTLWCRGHTTTIYSCADALLTFSQM